MNPAPPRSPLRPSLAAAALALATALVAPAPASAAGPVPATAIGGADRYATAVAVSRATCPTSAPAVVVASGEAWADALGGSALAGAVRGPVLLSPAASLPAPVAAELRRLGASRAFVLGGPRALSARVESQVAAALGPGATVVRIGGRDRYEVARAVAARTALERGAPPERVFVVTGATYPDALSCSAPAAARAWPILLANPTRPAEVAAVAASLDASSATIVGGTRSVPAAVERALDAELGASHVGRVAAVDRYATSVAVSRFASATAGLTPAHPVVASGLVHGDGLVGGVLAARRGAPLLLARASGLPEPLGSELFANRNRVASFAFLGGSRAMPAHVRTAAQHALRARPYSNARAMAHIKALTALGARRAGSSAELAAADYVAKQLATYGYTVSTQRVSIPGGYSRNVVAEKPGTSSQVIVLGGHLDSKPPSPGGNDNASGVAVTLEIARVLADAEGLVPTVRFIGFGAEEISGARPIDHHFGSRHYVRNLSTSQRNAIASAVSIDMVGYGSVFNIRNLGVAPMTAVGSLQRWGRYTTEPLAYLKDPSRDGWSDHEAFEFAGIPAAWLEWRTDPVYHTRGDNYAHVQPSRVSRTGELVRGWVLDLDAADLNALR